MRRVRSSGTEPEQMLLRAVRARGRRPITNAGDLPGKPDLLFSAEQLAVFVDGDYWHGRQWRERGHATLFEQMSGSNDPDYWVRKIHGNTRRDLEQTARLISSGYRVLRLWESEIRADVEACCDLVYDALEPEFTPGPFNALASATVADFFAGVGLMGLGLRRAGWRTVWANDMDPKKRRLFLHNHREDRVDVDGRDIRKIGVASLPAVSLASACFPCTDLSLAGKGAGFEGEHSSAYLRFAWMLRRMGRRKPPFVVLENVVGLIHSHGGRDFRACITMLGEAGYRADALVLDAKRFTPQSRPRLFIVGVRDDIDVGPYLPFEELTPSPARPASLVDFIASHPDLRWAIRPVPPLPEQTARLREILEDVPLGDDSWWSRERVEKFRAQVSERHLAMIEERLDTEAVVYAPAFRRMRHGRSMAELRFDGLAGCLRTPKGGSAKQMLARIDREGWNVRLLTPLECQRLMGATEFRADAEGVTRDDLYFAFGDAVCVPAVEWLVTNTINPIACELLRGRVFVPE